MAADPEQNQHSSTTGRPALGAVLQALRRAGGISQEGWAARLGVGRRTVVRWEQGDTVPDEAMTEALIAVCQEKGLFRRIAGGPQPGLDLNPDTLRDLIARARLAGSREQDGRRMEVADAPPPTTPPTLTGNLPAPLTSFVGREAERAEIVRLLASARLITLTGAGGCGKTRLAIETASQLRSDHSDGVWLVELAAVTDPVAVVPATATVFGLHEEAGQSLMNSLLDFMRARRLLLVLDNCEHLAAACAELAGRLLRSCPSLTILVTSRVPLGVLGEHVWRVPSLAIPGLTEPPDVAALARTASVRLFVERAGAVRPGFTLTPVNAAAVAQICRRLDGIPLALELAAARIAALSAEQIAAHLDDRFALLTTGNRAALPRHQTLRALLDWSYALLTPDERVLFERLSVFSGGCTLDAIAAVCSNTEPGTDSGGSGHEAGQPSPTIQLLNLLNNLVDHSLVTARESGGVMHYGMLETLRHYALTRLSASGRLPDLRARHGAYFVALAEQAEVALQGPEQVGWLNRLTDEHDNLRAALHWFLEEQGDAEQGLRLAGALWRFWERRGYAVEGLGWLARALARTQETVTAPAVRSKALGAAASLALGQGDYATARGLYSESLVLARRAGEPALIATALTRLGLVRINDRDFSTARTLLEEGLAIRRKLNDAWGIGNTLHNLAYLTYSEGDVPGARTLYRESLAVKQSTGDQEGIAVTLNNLGALAQAAGAYQEAYTLYEESLSIRRRMGDERGVVFALRGLGELAWRQGDVSAAEPLFAEGLRIAARLGMRKSIADCLTGLAAVAMAQEQPEQAAQRLGMVAALRRMLNVTLLPDERAQYEQIAAQARMALGDPAFAAARQRGEVMPPNEAVTEALAGLVCNRDAGGCGGPH